MIICHVTFASLKATESICFPGTKEVLDVVSSFCDLKNVSLKTNSVLKVHIF